LKNELQLTKRFDMKNENEELLNSNLETTINNVTQQVFNAIDKESNYYKSLCKDVKMIQKTLFK